ncbi:MAG TPA: bacterial transcriptional activator domain-containing protein, partial [Acidimicrobiales bacterium]|nr:bacterial transcriptional activator domain-containing protein [Acidimicrobiales bacterium]
PAARRLLAEVPRVPAETVVVRFLGPAELQRGDELVDSPLWRRGRVRQLLAFLVIYGQTTREAVVDAFWPDLDPAAANNNLRSTLSNLLTVLTPERRSKEASYFVAQQGRVLAPTGTDRLVVDVWEAERLFDEAAAAERSGTPSLARVAYARALDLWRGPFLADTPAAWAEAEAERLRLRFVAAWVRAGELALAAGDPAEAGARATAAIEAEPWSENAYRLLAGAQLARGDRAAARHSLDRARAMLDDLGVEPESATRLLERRLGGEIGAGAG